MAVAVGAEQFEVAELVAAAVAERDPMVDVEASGGAAADADLVSFVDAGAELAPGPAASDLASLLPPFVPRGAPRASASRSGEGAAVEAGAG
jgi:hypothetical protein